MSNINTNGIDITYPTPGINNSTQGFRDNFTSIKNNLSTAKTEITDLQSKVLVKSALNDTTLDNNMSGGVISNVQTKGFRSSTWAISAGDIAGSATIDVSKGDVQYGTVAENSTINFGGWAPSGTRSSVQLNLTVSNAQALISLPVSTYNANTEIVSGMKSSVRILENYSSNANPAPSTTVTNYVTVPQGVTELQLNFSTTDCGTTIDVEPVNRNQVSSRIELRVPSAIGIRGDTAGAICTDGTYLYICTGNYDGTTHIWTSVALTGM